MTDLLATRSHPFGGPDRSLARLRLPLTSDRTVALRRSAVALVLVCVAFHYSLSTLVRTLKSQTPLAYLGLVPVISLLLAAAQFGAHASEPSIHDRQVDYIVGIPLLVAPVLFDILMPIRLSTMFWLDRLDLLALPIFTAGVIAVIFGVRTLWRLKIPVVFLILAWPLPYSTLLTNWLSAFTTSTLGGLNVLLHFVHVAGADPGQGSGTYLVRHGGSTFPVSVASACSGVNGIVGYLLVAVAFVTIVIGTTVRKLLWLCTGLVAVWASNVTRIFIVVFVAHGWGETFAIDVLHPVIGLVTFNVVVLSMTLLLSTFGLRLAIPSRSGRAGMSRQVVAAVPRVRVALAVVAAVAIVGYLANSTLRQYDLVLSDLGAPRLVSFSDSPNHPPGWTVSRTATYTWAKPFFGEDSTWYRYQFSWGGSGTSALQSSEPVISDVINTSDVTSFSTYGIEACYQFHGYKLYSIRTVDLGGGVTGNVLAYYNSSTRSDWTTLYWHWPVRTPSGGTRYERVTLMLVNANNARFSAPPPSVSTLRALGLSAQNALGGKGDRLNASFDRTRTFLIEFAHAVITGQAAGSAPAGGAPKPSA